MSIEPDTIVLHRLYPWLEKSRLRIITFGVFVTIGVIVISFLWLTRFYSAYIVLNIYLVVVLVFLLLIYFYPILHETGGETQQNLDFCPECGSLQIGSRFCPYCGRRNY